MLCPHWETMRHRVIAYLRREQNLSADALVDEQAVYVRWNMLLRTPAKTWRLCNNCFSTLGPYLPPRPVHQGSGSDLEGLEYLLPINTSVWAIVAGYFGLFAVLFFPAPIALILGIIALRDINIKRSNGNKMAGMGRAIFAIVMGLIFTGLLLFFIGVMMVGSFGNSKL